MATYPFNQTTPKKGSDGYLWNWLGSPLKKFAQAIQPYISGGGGGGGVTEVTYPELQTLISGGTLVPGVTYKITGFNKNNPGPNLPFVLYDDGTNSGITIYMQAMSTTEMATSGFGEFYNPKYTGEPDYYNIDGTGLYSIWDGDNPDPLQVPAYGVGDVVFWGGYAWVNQTGNVGNSIDVRTLSVDWSKLPYTNTTYYNQVVDEIKVDWDYGIIVERRNAANDINVKWTPQLWENEGYDAENINPIAVIPWGNYADVISGYDYGVATLSVIDSYAEFVNFKGTNLSGNAIGIVCSIYDNYFGINTNFRGNELRITNMYGNIITNSSFFGNTTFTSLITGNTLLNSGMSETELLDNCMLGFNTLTNANMEFNKVSMWSTINDNTLTNNSGIYYNTIHQQSVINDNALDNSSTIENNVLTISSVIESNIFNTGTISQNSLNNSDIVGNDLINGGAISSNILNDNCLINDYQLVTGDGIKNNTLTNNTLMVGTTAGVLGGQIIQNNTIRNALITANLASASHVFAPYSKDIFTRQDGTVKLSYFDNSDVLTVVAVNA